jgi:hypothetical protein
MPVLSLLMAVTASVEWGVLASLVLMGHLAWMCWDWAALSHQWTQDWLSGPAPWLTLLFMPACWAFRELGRWLMWCRWRGPAVRWRLNWVGPWPVPGLDPAEVAGLRGRAQRVSLHAWGLIHGGLLLSLSWTLSQSLQDEAWRLVARAWLYASGITLLLVDCNPLWRGGVLALLQEAARQPDLAARSQAWWLRKGLHLAGLLAGLRGAAWRSHLPRVHLPAWAIWHAPLAWCMQWVLACWLVQVFAHRHPHLALVLLGSAGMTLLLQPLWRGWRLVLASPALAARRARLQGALMGMVVALGAWLFIWPWPQNLVVPGVVWLPTQARVVAPVDGVLVSVLARGGQAVGEGQALWRLVPLHLRALDVDADQMVDAPGDWGRLTLRSEVAGTWHASLDGDTDGRVVRRGQELGVVLPEGPATVRCVVPASHAGDLLNIRQVSVRLQEQPEHLLVARRTAAQAQPLLQLPARNLSGHSGGPVAVLSDDPQGLTPAEPMVGLDVQVDQALPRTGGLAWVKLGMAPQPLAWQAWGTLRAMWRAGR